MTLRTPSLFVSDDRATAWIATVVIGFSAGITSTVFTVWAPLSNLGRTIVFLGSCLSGTALAHRAFHAETRDDAFKKCVGGGVAQAFVSAALLVFVAHKLDAALDISPMLASAEGVGNIVPGFFVAATLIGMTTGVVYAIIPSHFVARRARPSMANDDRTMIETAVWLTVLGVAHSVFVNHAAAWAPLVAIALVLAFVALVRIAARTRFLSRVRAGREPRYRIVDYEEQPTRGRQQLVRIDVIDDREKTYRENAAPAPAPRAIAFL